MRTDTTDTYLETKEKANQLENYAKVIVAHMNKKKVSISEYKHFRRVLKRAIVLSKELPRETVNDIRNRYRVLSRPTESVFEIVRKLTAIW